MGWLWGVTAGPLDVRGGHPGVGILLLQISQLLWRPLTPYAMAVVSTPWCP